MSTAVVESFKTYYATCPACRWDGPDREADAECAQLDADQHVCEPEPHAAYQATLDGAHTVHTDGSTT